MRDAYRARGDGRYQRADAVRGRFTTHEALLDGDEDRRVGCTLLIHDGDVTYLSATVIAHAGDLWALTLQREHE